MSILGDITKNKKYLWLLTFNLHVFPLYIKCTSIFYCRTWKNFFLSWNSFVRGQYNSIPNPNGIGSKWLFGMKNEILGQIIKFCQNTWNYWDIKWNYREKNKIIGTKNKTVWPKPWGPVITNLWNLKKIDFLDRKWKFGMENKNMGRKIILWNINFFLDFGTKMNFKGQKMEVLRIENELLKQIMK